MNKNEPLLSSKYAFRTDVLDILIGGKSAIDSSAGFQVHGIEEAHEFIKSYGYDLENPIERAEILGNFHEALSFIRKHFLQPENSEGLKLEIPRKILELTDIRELFLMASLLYPGQTAEQQGLLLKKWANCILKIMHTIAHIDKDIRTSYFPDIQKQIFDRFYKLVHRDIEGQLFIGEKEEDPLRVNLAAFETKPKKSRNSIIIKLLHKPENVAEDIFDQVGIRFITYSRLDALRVIKYLKDKMIVIPPNIKPSRSRNTLINIENLSAHLNDYLARAERREISESKLISDLDRIIAVPRLTQENPHSSQFYKAIQFTCRQLIKLQNPLYEELKELKGLIRTKPQHEDIVRIVDRMDLAHLQREIRFFYPFEVQVVDKASAEENEKGRSAHSEYKRAQIQTAMKRVMGSLMDGSR